jgi:hypothetical protein
LAAILKTTRGKLLRCAPLDAWVALSKDETRITASGATYDEVSKLLDDAGEQDSVILKTPKAWLPLTLSLDELVSRIAPENLYAETDCGEPLGKEVW